MVSHKKLLANQRNAQRSTGPKTEEGKSASSLNAIKHGLTSHTCAVLPGEDAEEYRSLSEQIHREQRPHGVLQKELVDHLVQLIWKLRRIPGIENAIIEYELKCIERSREMNRRFTEPAPTLADVLASQFLSETNGLSRLEIYRQRLDRNIHATLRQLRKLREESEPEEEPTPSPGTPGEGRGEGSVSTAEQSDPQKNPHPNPLPEYRARGPEAGGQNEPTDSPIDGCEQEMRGDESPPLVRASEARDR